MATITVSITVTASTDIDPEDDNFRECESEAEAIEQIRAELHETLRSGNYSTDDITGEDEAINAWKATKEPAAGGEWACPSCGAMMSTPPACGTCVDAFPPLRSNLD